MTTPQEVLAYVRESLAAVANPRFFENEPGFQGQLLVEMGRRMHLVTPMIMEQEHQKRMLLHGFKFRPDIIIHEPFDPARHASRADGNLAVMELKVRATPAKARIDYEKLASFIRVLDYPLGIFININSNATHEHRVPDEARGRIVSFAVALRGGKVQGGVLPGRTSATH